MPTGARRTTGMIACATLNPTCATVASTSPRPGAHHRDGFAASRENPVAGPAGIVSGLERLEGQSRSIVDAISCGFLRSPRYRQTPAFGHSLLVSGSYFSVLGLRPVLGRLIRG